MGIWKRTLRLLKLSDDSAVQNESGVKTIRILRDPVGSSGTEIFSGYYNEEYLQDLSGSKAADIYDKMRRSDPQIKMVLSAVKNPIKAATWDVEPADESDQAKHIADFVKHALFDDMDKPFSTFLNEALTYVDFGHSVFEITHKIVMNHKKFGTYNGIRSFGFRAQKTIERWNLDPSTGKLVSISQYAFGDLQRMVDIPAEHLVVFTRDKEGDNYQGISDLRPVYGPWLRKNVYLKLNAIGIEKSAVPTPIGKVPDGKENSDQFANFVAALEIYTSHQANYIVTPHGWDIELQANDFDPAKVEASIDAEDKRIAKAFLAQFLELGTGGGGGSWALSTDQSDFFLGGIQHVADGVCDGMNQGPIVELVKMNFGPQEKYPKLKVSGISDKAGKELAEILSTCSNAKIITPDVTLEEHTRTRYGLPKKEQKALESPGAQPPTGTGNPADDIQKQALNGAQVSSIIEIVKNVASKTLPRESGIALIKYAFQMDQVTAEQVMSQAGIGFTIQPEPVKLSERTIRLAETEARRQIQDGKAALKSIMQSHIKAMGADLAKQIKARWDGLSEDRKIEAITGLNVSGAKEYQAELIETLAKISSLSLSKARKEVPSKGAVKLAGESGDLKLGEFERLPPSVRKQLLVRSQLLVESQMADLKKSVLLMFAGSVNNTDKWSELEQDILAQSGEYLEGASVAAAYGNAAAFTVNEARSAFFFDDDVLKDIEAFEFVNGDPQAPVCQDLAGRVFGKDDPESARYFPPLHHNCQSYIVPILKGADMSGRKIENLKPSSADLEKSITLSEQGA